MDATVADLIRAFETWAPPALAEEWDNVGLQVGSRSRVVRKVAVCLDLTPHTLLQAANHGVDAVITHHPLLFSPLRRLEADHWQGKLVWELVRRDISLVSLHTNLDSAREGVTDILAEGLGLEVEGALRPAPGARRYKVVTYVPPGAEDEVRRLVLESEAGVLGRYRGCTFSVGGQGSFLPVHGARPRRGESGRFNLVSEVRLELVVPECALSGLLERIREVHPYEEVPIDVYPLRGHDHRFGLGRVGRLAQEASVEEIARRLAELLGTEAVFLVGAGERTVRRVALCAGAGADLMAEALARGAELFVTAEVKYHQAREAEARGLPLIVVGHFESERLVVPRMARFLEDWAESRSCALEVIVLEEETPFRLLRPGG